MFVFIWRRDQCCPSSNTPPYSLAPLLPFFLSHASRRELLFLPKAPIFLLTLWRLRWLSSVASSWGAAAFGSDKMPSGGTLSTPAISALLSSRRRAPGWADRGTASTAVQCNSTSAVWCARDSWVPRTGQVCVYVWSHMNLYRGGKARQKCTCIDQVETFAKQMFLHVLFSAGLHFSLNHDLDFVFFEPLDDTVSSHFPASSSFTARFPSVAPFREQVISCHLCQGSFYDSLL